MKRFMKWTAGIVGATVGAVFMFRAVQAGRQRVKHALGQAEAIADRTRATLEQTEVALREARDAI
jgi:intracellular septation protein A